MRTEPFREIWNKTLRLHGRDAHKPVSPDLRDALVDHINDRVRTIWQIWRWPEWELTEERAFRQIWDNDEEYLLVSTTDGQPDEVFYLGDAFVAGGEFGENYGYYRVIADPPITTKPTNPTYWEPIDITDTFIQYDQRGRRSIGMVLGIYKTDPRISCHGKWELRYMPSEKGIDVYCPGVPTVFVTHKMPCPVYTMVPYVVGKTYFRADVVFDPATGECFQAVRPTTSAPQDLTNSDDWNLVPFIEEWTDYVSKGAFADSLMEFDQGGGADIQAKMVQNQYWNQQADDALQQEVDGLATQGQKLTWNFCRQRSDHWCESQVWTGGMVSLLGQ